MNVTSGIQEGKGNYFSAFECQGNLLKQMAETGIRELFPGFQTLLCMRNQSLKDSGIEMTPL
jgi:hypothetical protein